jgi:hypothetical protein
VEIKEQYQVKILNWFTALENLDDDDVDTNRAWENIRENIKASATEINELKQNKAWFDEECSKL